MFNHFSMLCKNIKSFDVCKNNEESCVENIWISFFDKMKEKKKIEILLNGIKRLYSKNNVKTDRRINERSAESSMQRIRCVT